VRIRRWMPWLTAALAAGALAVVAGGFAQPESADKATKAQGGTFRVGIVTDIGGLNDRGFNQLANTGLIRAKTRLKVQTRALISNSQADYIPNFTSLARQNYDLIIGIGFLQTQALETMARRYPKIKWAGIDVAIEGMKTRPKNYRGLLFREQEAGYLVGYMAGLQIKAKPFSGQQTLSTVGGQKIPPVDRFIAGFRAGARAANPQVRLLNDYSQDFVDQAKCKELALAHIQRGAGIIFQVAGGCGLGALDAAKSRAGVFGIGVDADQSFLGPHVLTSAQKKVDVAVYSTIAAAMRQKANFKGGINVIFGVKEGGVGYGKISARATAGLRARAEAVRKRIAAGQIKIPTAVR